MGVEQPMTTQHFERQIELPVSAAAAFAWHERPGALERLIPPWENVRIVRATGGLQDGAQVELVARLGPLRVRWRAEHYGYDPPLVFRDSQRSGPFARWEHTHRFTPLAAQTCRLTDHVEYKLHGHWWGQMLGGGIVHNQLEQMFAYRQQTTAADLAAHARYAERIPMQVLVSGSTGLVGSALCPLLTTGGHQVTKLVRGEPKPGEAHWDIQAREIDAEALSAADAVVHLAGESIAAGRWNTAKKARILNSRVEGTRLLCEALAKLTRPPQVLVCASAIGYYGSRGDEWLDESSAPGDGFLADVCRQWENATRPASDAGIRVVNARFGVILSPRGGALAQMLFPFKTGGGGVISSGKQFWSWISLDDVVGAIHHALLNENLHGPVNVVAPNPVTNTEFTKTLGKVLRRPTIFPLPAFVARLVLGEMANELLLASQRVRPRKLTETNYEFRHPELETALRAMLGRR
jgi:uncharacterized protein (TIGR01777 family)